MRYLLAIFGFGLLPLPLFASDGQQAVASARVVDVARNELAARLAGDGDKTSLTTIGAPEDVRVPAGVVSVKARPVMGQWPRPRVGVPVDVIVDGRVVRSTTVWFALSIHRDVLTYREDLPIGTLASSIHAVPDDVDVTTCQGALIASPKDLAGMRLHHPVRAGAPVLAEDFERVPDVDRHQKVNVLVTYGAIHLAARGTANEMGYAGDVVPVLVDGADVPVLARIADKGVVEVVQ